MGLVLEEDAAIVDVLHVGLKPLLASRPWLEEEVGKLFVLGRHRPREALTWVVPSTLATWETGPLALW